MDTGVQTTSPQPQSPQSSRPQNLHMDNLAAKPVKYASLSDKRKIIAAKAKGERQITNQEGQFHPNYKPVANLAFQSNQLRATPIYQSTPLTKSQNLIQPTLQQHYHTIPFISNSSPYTNPPMPVFPLPMVYNPPMPEQLPKPPKNFNETTPLHQRIGTKPINPIIIIIIENIIIKFNRAKFLGPDQKTRDSLMQIHPKPVFQRVVSTYANTNNHQAPRLVTRTGLETTTRKTTQILKIMKTTLY